MSFATVTTVAGAEEISGQPGQSMECAFTVTSEPGATTRVGLQAMPEGDTPSEWLQVIGERERDLPGSGSEDVTVRISVPADAKAGRYPFRLRAYASDDPEQSAESPAVAVEVPEADKPIPEKPKKAFPWWAVGVAAVFVLLIGGGATWFLLASGAKVPSVTGDTLDVAMNKLEEAGLLPGAVTEEFTGDTEAGVVLSQKPEAGTKVDKDSEVALSIEAVSVEVPKVVGQPVTEASETLTAAGLETGEITKEKRAGQKGGTVLQQTPAPGERVLPDTPVALTVVDEVIVVASLVGQTHAEAVKSLSELGLRPGRITERRTGGTRGVVLSHRPAANTRVAPGSRVELVLEENRVAVPNVRGKSSSYAVSRLKRSGLKAKVTMKYDGRNVSKVVAQSPRYNARVRPGSTVNITVGAHKRKVLSKHVIQYKQLRQQGHLVKRDAGTLRVVSPNAE